MPPPFRPGPVPRRAWQEAERRRSAEQAANGIQAVDTCGRDYYHATARGRTNVQPRRIGYHRAVPTGGAMSERPNVLVILIDDLRFDEFGAGGHPYMKTPHIDRLAREGALFERAFHTTPICSPNRASMLTGQYASRHGIIDNVARDAASYRLPNYHVELQRLGYETAHLGKWHMGNSGKPRPGYDFWIAYDGHGRLNDPKLNEHGAYVEHRGYITDIMNT